MHQRSLNTTHAHGERRRALAGVLGAAAVLAIAVAPAAAQAEIVVPHLKQANPVTPTVVTPPPAAGSPSTQPAPQGTAAPAPTTASPTPSTSSNPPAGDPLPKGQGDLGGNPFNSTDFGKVTASEEATALATAAIVGVLAGIVSEPPSEYSGYVDGLEPVDVLRCLASEFQNLNNGELLHQGCF
jgi:hypothetical protein